MRILVLILALIAGTAAAVEPGEQLSDPVLEARARALSSQLRCPVCQSENIDESRAPIARDLRLLVRERLMAGDSDEEILTYVAARFGEAVLMRPRADGWGLVLWLLGPAMLLLAAVLVAIAARGRRPGAALSAEETARLKEITGP